MNFLRDNYGSDEFFCEITMAVMNFCEVAMALPKKKVEYKLDPKNV